MVICGTLLTCDESSDDHGVFTSQHLPVGHVTGKHWAENTGNVDQSIVSPALIGSNGASQAGSEISVQENVEQRVGKANQSP